MLIVRPNKLQALRFIVALPALSLFFSPLLTPAAAEQPGVLMAARSRDTGSAPAAGPAEPLPVKDVVLFTSGVGYFQRSGSVDGSAAIPLTFRTSHVDDILKSLLLIDPQGHVEPVTYTSQEPVEQALRSFGINVSANLSMVDLLQQLRGVRVQITTRPPHEETITGQVLSVETHPVEIKEDNSPVKTEDEATLNLVTDTGIRSISMKDVRDLKILDEALAAQLKGALGVLANGHDPQTKTITLHFGGGGNRNVQVGYVTEAPVWKTSYRLALDEKPYMQGWAIVDNSTDHDWDNIQLTLVSGRPISFIQDLYTPLYVPRPIVPPDVQANPYPQLAEDNLMENARYSTMGYGHMTQPQGNYGLRPLSPSTGPAAKAAAPIYNRFGQVWSIDGNTSLPLDHVSPTLPRSGVESAATGAMAGELFEYKIGAPVTIPRQQSAMIPIVTETVTANKIDLFNADVNARNPENAVQLTNSTHLHLKAGPVTVLDGGSYAGDARMPELEPGEKQLITYAVDLSIVGVRSEGDPDQVISSFSIKHGVLTVSNREQVTTKYTFKSKLDRDRVVLVEQPIRPNWNLREPAKPDEKTASYYRFQVPVKAGASVPFSVVQATLEDETVGLIDADVNTLLEYRKD
ncbi:MAG: DUF4139 domain-containing protein, partial [Armatimonadota bacterium]|nr:DUF4139 domain-containing protein [Armatimonadota bacterium]